MANPPSLSLRSQRALPPPPDAKSPLRPQVAAARLPGKTATLIRQHQQVTKAYLPRELQAAMAAEQATAGHQPLGAQRTVADAVDRGPVNQARPLAPMPAGLAVSPIVAADAVPSQPPTTEEIQAHLGQLSPLAASFQSYALAFNQLRDPRTLGTMNYLHATNHGGVAEFGRRTAMAAAGRLRANFKAEFKVRVEAELKKLVRQPGYKAENRKSALKALQARLKAQLTQELLDLDQYDASKLQPTEFIGPRPMRDSEDVAVKEALDRVFSSHLQLMAVCSVEHRSDAKAKAIAAMEKTLDTKLMSASKKRDNEEGKAPIVLEVKTDGVGGRLAVEIFTRMPLLLKTYGDVHAKLDSPDFAKADFLKKKTVEEIREQIANFPIKLEMASKLLLEAAQSDEIKHVPEAQRALGELAYALEILKSALAKPLQRVVELIDAPLQEVARHRVLKRRGHAPDPAAAKAAIAAVKRHAVGEERLFQPLTIPQPATAA